MASQREERGEINKCRINKCPYARSTGVLNKRMLGSCYGSLQHNQSVNDRNWKKKLVQEGFWESALWGAHIHGPAPLLGAVHLASQRPSLIHVSPKPLCTASEASDTENGILFCLFSRGWGKLVSCVYPGNTVVTCITTCPYLAARLKQIGLGTRRRVPWCTHQTVLVNGCVQRCKPAAGHAPHG